MSSVFQRRTTGSVVCPSCGSLVGVRDDKCYSAAAQSRASGAIARLLRQLGADFGFVPLVIGASSVLYVLTLLVSGRQLQIVGGGFSFLSPSFEALLLFGMRGRTPVFELGRWWTVLSASWLHGNLLHILFNMMWVRDLGPAMADVIGPARTIIIYVVVGHLRVSPQLGRRGPHGGCADFASCAAERSRSGASASIFGLLGALVHYGEERRSSLIRAVQAMRYAIILFVFGLIMPGVDNYAHAGGFVGGYMTSAFLHPLTRERGDHMIGAACLRGGHRARAGVLGVQEPAVVPRDRTTSRQPQSTAKHVQRKHLFCNRALRSLR